MNMKSLAELGRIVAHTMPTTFSYSLAHVSGLALYYSWPRARRHMKECAAAMLDLPLDAPLVKKTARRGMINFTRYCADFVRYSSDDFFEREKFNITGLEHLDKALAEGKGIILASFHLGNFDLGIRLLGENGYPVNAVVNQVDAGQLNDFVTKCRGWSNVTLIDSRETISTMVDVLRRNEILALMLDCPDNKRNVAVRLGNRLAIAPSGAATLALRTGARVIPCGMVRKSRTSFEGFVGEPVEFTPSGSLREDTRELTQRIFTALERQVIRFLDQWYIFRPIFHEKSILNTTGVVENSEVIADNGSSIRPFAL